MKQLRSGIRSLVLPLSLLAASCVDDSGGGIDHTGSQPAYGTFLVSLVEPTATDPGLASFLGQLFSGPTPASYQWEEGGKSGSCRVFKPRVPFCEQSCGSEAKCVADYKCQDFPKALEAGRVTVDGLKTGSGAASFSMDPIAKSYQPSGGLALAYPPFAEGDVVSLSAAGGASVAAFSLSTRGIKPLEAVQDSFTLADGKPIELRWTPAQNPGASIISVLIDLSHHGVTKGKIECEAPDDGKLQIAAVLVDELRALGVSGYPKIEVARKAVAAKADGHVELVLESRVTRPLGIPGLISCTENAECPDGQKCQPDDKCL